MSVKVPLIGVPIEIIVNGSFSGSVLLANKTTVDVAAASSFTVNDSLPEEAGSLMQLMVKNSVSAINVVPSET